MYILEVGKPVGPLVLELQAVFAYLPLPNHTRILDLLLVADEQLFFHSSVARPSVWSITLNSIQIDYRMLRLSPNRFSDETGL